MRGPNNEEGIRVGGEQDKETGKKDFQSCEKFITLKREYRYQWLARYVIM